MLGYLTGILYLAPYKESVAHGGGNLCPMASEACALLCLNTAGRGRFEKIQMARIKKTVYFFKHRESFWNDFEKSVLSIERKAKRQGLIPAIRANGTSDYPFYKASIMEKFRHIQMYNYTKIFSRMMEYLDGKMAANEHFTFSRSEKNEPQCLEVLKRGGNVAVVYKLKKDQPFPNEWNGYEVIDGDSHDLRFLDKKNVVVGLRAKGRAKKDTMGFAIEV